MSVTEVTKTSIYVFTGFFMATFALNLGQAADLLPTIPKSSLAIELQTVASGLNAPNQAVSLRDGSGRLLITEQQGTVRLWENGDLLETPFLDIRSTTLSTGWRGLHGVAAHPSFSTPGNVGEGKVYVITSEAAGTGVADLGHQPGGGADHQSVLYEYRVSSGSDNIVDPLSRREILRVNEPGTIHGLYSMTFGTDGYLYLGVGDGAGGGDPFGLSQDPGQAHGSILRIDVNGANGRTGQYGIPATNPFVNGITPDGQSALPEVFAYGFRNPWRMGVDTQTGDVYLGDVGRAVIEEVNRIESGKNYGWPLKEGTFKANPDATVTSDLSGLPDGLTDPLGQYEHDEGVSVIGGAVYRGSDIPSLFGTYVFADFGHPMGSPVIDHPARLFTMNTSTGQIEELQVGLDDRGFSTIGGRLPLGFGEDESGELYVLTDGGDMLKIVPVPEPSAQVMLSVFLGFFFLLRLWCVRDWLKCCDARFSTLKFSRRRGQWSFVFAVLGVFVIDGRTVFAAPTLSLARPVDAARFRVTTFAEGLAFPTSMASLSDGSLLVATSDGSTLWGSTSGRLVRLVDANADGVADGRGQTVATGLPGIVTSVRKVGDLVVALSSQTGGQAITFWRTGAAPGDTFTSAGQINFAFPSGFEHTTYALAARSAAGNPVQTEVYFNIGAAANSTATLSSNTVGLAGSGLNFASAAVVGDAIHRIVVTDQGASLDVSAPLQIASGLRNAAGMTFDAAGNLLLQDNGIDTEGNRGVSFSADELNRVDAADLGMTVPDFGFADTYVDYATGATVGPTDGVTAPLVDFRPVDGERSEGAVEIAMAPEGFGSDFDGGVFVAFYGMPGGGIANEENPVVFADPSTGDHYHFIENQLMGHPNGLLSDGDSLWLSDLSYTGSLSSTVGGVPANQAGVIYQITAVPEPSTLVMLATSAGLSWMTARRKKRRRGSSAG